MALTLLAACAAGTTDPGVESGEVEVDGAVIAYESLGSPEDETVLLIAGTGMQLTDWPTELVESLADEGYRGRHLRQPGRRPHHRVRGGATARRGCDR